MKGVKTMSLANGTSKRFHSDDLSATNIYNVHSIKTFDHIDLVEELRFIELSDKVNNSAPVVSELPTARGQSNAKPVKSMSQMVDVDLDGLEDGCVLVWNADVKKWTPANLD